MYCFESTAVERILTDTHSLPPSKSQVFFGPEGRYTRMSSLLLSATCEGCCWIGLKPRFTLGPCQGTLRNQLCMRTSLPFHIWMLLKLVSGSHVWISLSIVVTCSLAGFAGSMCSCYHQWMKEWRVFIGKDIASLPINFKGWSLHWAHYLEPRQGIVTPYTAAYGIFSYSKEKEVTKSWQIFATVTGSPTAFGRSQIVTPVAALST